MNNEIKKISETILEVFSGNPWYGKSISSVLKEIDERIVYKKPGPYSHSLIELIYHMITWSDFTKRRLERDKIIEPVIKDTFLWSETNPEIHTWNTGVAQLTASTNKILTLLSNSTDDLLEEQVDFRDYNFRFLLHGLIQHNIYHLGQIVYLNKFLLPSY